MRDGIKNVYEVMVAERELRAAELNKAMAENRLRRARQKMMQTTATLMQPHGCRFAEWLTPEGSVVRSERRTDNQPANTEDARQ